MKIIFKFSEIFKNLTNLKIFKTVTKLLKVIDQMYRIMDLASYFLFKRILNPKTTIFSFNLFPAHIHAPWGSFRKQEFY